MVIVASRLREVPAVGQIISSPCADPENFVRGVQL